MLKYDILDTDKLPKNGVIIIKTDQVTEEFMESLNELGKALKPALAGKNICVFILKPSDTLETQSPEDMEKYGWVKKNKGDLFVTVEGSQYIESLKKEVKSNKAGAIKDLAELLAEEIAKTLEKNTIDLILKK